METISLIVQVSTLATLFLGGLWVRQYFPAYMKRKGENLAAKEDSAELTRVVETARAPFVTEIEQLKHELQKSSQGISRRQELYIGFVEAAAGVFLSGRTATEEHKTLFLAKYSALVLFAPDQVVEAVNQHLRFQILAAQHGGEPFQEQLKQTLRTMILEMRKEAFVPDTGLQDDGFLFISFK